MRFVDTNLISVLACCARCVRNPKAGEKVSVLPKYIPHFKPGKEMRERVERSVERELIKLAA